MTSSEPGDGAEQSLVWRCRLCGRLHLFVEPTRHPAACHDCGSESFSASTGVNASASTVTFELPDGEPDGPPAPH